MCKCACVVFGLKDPQSYMTFFKAALWKEHSGLSPFKRGTKETEMGMQMIDKEFALSHVSSGPGNEVNITLKRHFYSSAKINLSFPF